MLCVGCLLSCLVSSLRLLLKNCLTVSATHKATMAGSSSAVANTVFSFANVHRQIIAFVLVHESPGRRWSRKKHWPGGCSQSCGCCRSHNREDACEECNCNPCYVGWILTTINKDWFAKVRWFANTEYPEEQNLRQLARKRRKIISGVPERVSAQATHEIVG